MEKRFKGIGVSPGVAIGQALILESKKPCFIYQFLLNTSEVKKEIEHFKKAVESVKREFKQLAKSLKKETTFKEARQILEIYISILSDPMLYKATIKRIKEEKINAEWALLKSLEEIENVFGMIKEDYLKQRIQDVHYVVNRILAILQPRFPSAKQSFPESVIIGHDLSPVEAIKLSSKIAIAFVTETGSLTSHIAIVTQALKLPAVVGVKEITNFIKPAEMVIVDGFQGEVIINPLAETLQYYQERRKEYKQYCDKIEHYALLPARTLEGHTLKVMANVELFEEIPSVLKMGADGIGLFRTEFFYLQQKRLPEEKLLYEYFSKVVKAIKPYPVTFRTLDMGGDKLSSALKFEKELNPALGLRAYSFLLETKKYFPNTITGYFKG
ncbi:Phosphoenolpyruvate-protein phosphotransferase [Candidatus Methanoperedenaceae archaeon GB50]|nr:Phosphoenolpyruvate-protein phosphotransferase [Candidatus Methanoperedenaceae archaeon GB50]